MEGPRTMEERDVLEGGRGGREVEKDVNRSYEGNGDGSNRGPPLVSSGGYMGIGGQVGGNVGYGSGGRVSAGTRRGMPEEDAETKRGKVFIGGLSWETNEDSLKEYFERFGPLVDCVIMRDRQTGKPRGFGFVTFAEEGDAKKAVQQRHELDGREVEAKLAVPRSESNAIGKPTKKIFVGGLPHEIRSVEFKDYFTKFGEVVDAQVMMDHRTGNSRGFGFVTFLEEESAERVLGRGLNTARVDFNGKLVEVKRAESRTALQSRREPHTSTAGSGSDPGRDRRPPTTGSGTERVAAPSQQTQQQQIAAASQNLQLSPHLAAQYASYYGGMWQQYAAAVVAAYQGGAQGTTADQSGYGAAAQQQQSTANMYSGVYGTAPSYGNTGGYGVAAAAYGADPRSAYGGGSDYLGGSGGGGSGGGLASGGGSGSNSGVGSGGAARHVSSRNDRYHPYGR